MIGSKIMAGKKKKIIAPGEQQWENPLDPLKPSDARDKEQIERQYREAKRRKDNLTEKDHIDREPKED
jgi:hypothetical protein